MSLFNEIPLIKVHIDTNRATLKHNVNLFDIYEGELLPQLEAELKNQLSAKSFHTAVGRVAPINIMKRIVDKLSKIYSKDPTRIITGTAGDTELFEGYFKSMRINKQMNFSNEFFNTFKNNLIMPFANQGKVKLRVVPSERFLPMSLDPVEPTRMTHLILFMGSRPSENGGFEEIIYVYTDEEFMIINEQGTVLMDLMAGLGMEDGFNFFLKIPGVYTNRSLSNIVPPVDTDMLKMTLLIPILLSDLNFAVMFQAFSIIWGIDLDDENLEMSPNAFWRFKTSKSSNGSESKPQIGSIKPQVDISEVFEFTLGQLSLWLESKNIKPGSIGKMDGRNFANASAKIIDEMDTSEDRQKQVDFYEDTESELWDLVAHNMHPHWRETGEIEEKRLFTDEAAVETVFNEQRPFIKRIEVINEVEKEMELRVLDRRRAAKRLNPEMTDKEIDQLLADADADRTIEMEDENIEEEDLK